PLSLSIRSRSPLLSLFLSVLFLNIRPPPLSTLFPYTTLFRSLTAAAFCAALSVGNRCRKGATRAQLPGIAASAALIAPLASPVRDRKSTRLNSSHGSISYAVFCLKKKKHSTHIGGTPSATPPDDTAGARPRRFPSNRPRERTARRRVHRLAPGAHRVASDAASRAL